MLFSPENTFHIGIRKVKWTEYKTLRLFFTEKKSLPGKKVCQRLNKLLCRSYLLVIFYLCCGISQQERDPAQLARDDVVI